MVFYYTISQWKCLFHPKIKCSAIRIISHFNKHESQEMNFQKFKVSYENSTEY